jgi:hypothetical protein
MKLPASPMVAPIDFNEAQPEAAMRTAAAQKPEISPGDVR